MKQTTFRLFMVRPAGFRSNEETADNSFQQTQGEQNVDVNDGALEEFDAFVAQLKAHGVEVFVAEADEANDTPDALFPNNWISFHEDGKAAVYPMKAPNRRRERNERVIYDLCNVYGLDLDEIVDFTEFEDHERFLEGTGSMVLDRVNKVCYAALSERTDEGAVALFCETMGYTPVCFETLHPSGKPVYHTNVIMCIGTEFVVICEDVIAEPSVRQRVMQQLEATGRKIVRISIEQLNQFAGNTLEVMTEEDQPRIVLSKNAWAALDQQQRAMIEQCGQVITPELTTIETYGGGSARCMLCEVFLPKI